MVARESRSFSETKAVAATSAPGMVALSRLLAATNAGEAYAQGLRSPTEVAVTSQSGSRTGMGKLS
jgi:hypothetical protein